MPSTEAKKGEQKGQKGERGGEGEGSDNKHQIYNRSKRKHHLICLPLHLTSVTSVLADIKASTQDHFPSSSHREAVSACPVLVAKHI